MANLTPAEVQKLLDSIPAETRPIFDRVLSVVAMQAAMIDDLVWQLDIDSSASALQKQVMGPALGHMATALQQPIVHAPTIKEVSDEITQMQTALETAAAAKSIFQTVLSYALKTTPLGPLL